MATIRARALGVRFLFDRDQRVMTPGRARLTRSRTETWGLRQADVSIAPGEGVALIGPVGSGKTTLLRVIADVLPADEGSIEVAGRVATLLSPDGGTLETLTGRENAMLLAVLAGLNREQAAGRMEAVRESSGLGDAFDRPVSSYSQGMLARLSFTAAMQAGPSILVLDEVHEAFDHAFRMVLERRASELLAAGGILVAAGHDHEVLRRLCDRALFLDSGRVRADGPFDEVRRHYLDEGAGRTAPAPGAPGTTEPAGTPGTRL
jgi:ABC-type polysaccharide/polyol phosphate transport system ATPase subunit